MCYNTSIALILIIVISFIMIGFGCWKMHQNRNNSDFTEFNIGATDAIIDLIISLKFFYILY